MLTTGDQLTTDSVNAMSRRTTLFYRCPHAKVNISLNTTTDFNKLCRRHNMPPLPPPTSSDLNTDSHQELSRGRSWRMSVIILQRHHTPPRTKFEVIGLLVPKMWVIFGHGVNGPGDDLLTSKGS